MKRLLHALAALWSLPTRTGSSPCQSADLPIRKIASESAHPQISESTLNKKTIFHLERRYCNVLAYMTLFMCLIAAYKAPAQTGAAVNMDEIQPLQIGDTIPEELWHLPLQVVNHPEGKETITLNDYRGKLIILDFWSTWCGACIESMPKMGELQSQFKEDLKIVPITRQSSSVIKPFWEKNSFLSKSGLSTIVGDSMLAKWYPHKGLPHLVWINKRGETIAITFGNTTNPNTIKSALEGKPIETFTKNDFAYRENLMLPNNAFESNSFFGSSYSVLTGYRADALPIKGIEIDSAKSMVRIYYLNYSLYHIFKDLLDIGSIYNNRTVWETEGQIKPFQYIEEHGLTAHEWQKKYAVCYEAVVPSQIDQQKLSEYILADLRVFTGIGAKKEIREVDCLILTKVKNISEDTPSHFLESDASISKLVGVLNRALPQYPVLNEVEDWNGSIDHIARDSTVWNDLPELKSQLWSNGLELTIQKRPLELLVFFTAK